MVSEFLRVFDWLAPTGDYGRQNDNHNRGIKKGRQLGALNFLMANH